MKCTSPTRQRSFPAALAGAIGGIYGLNDFHPKPKDGANVSTTVGSHAMTPSDFATIYDVNPLYAAGIDGTGVSMAIIGLSEITINDYRSFRKMFNLSAVDPQMVLVGPSPGTVQSWNGEGLLDLEWAGAVAPNANLSFVYGTNIATAVQAAIDRSVGQIISSSYAACELSGTTNCTAVWPNRPMSKALPGWPHPATPVPRGATTPRRQPETDWRSNCPPLFRK